MPENLIYSILIAQSVVIALLAVLVVGLLRSHAETLKTLDRLGAGSDPGSFTRATGHNHDEGIPQPGHELEVDRPAPDLVGIDPTGEAVAISTTTNSGPLLLAFLSTSCSSCGPFWESLDNGRMAVQDRLVRAVAVTLGPDEESPTRAGNMSTSTTVLMSSQAWRDYGVPGAPYFVLVDTVAGRVLGEGSAAQPAQLASLVADATADHAWDLQRSKKSKADLERETRIDEELMKAGIKPGDPQLYPAPGKLKRDENL
ncbi:MAG: hypothetical protein WD354_03175 [Acidimicrobiia bacterium]